MKRALLYITVTDLLFILLLALSGMLSGALGRAVYYLAFLLPFVFAFLSMKRAGLPAHELTLKISGEDALLSLSLLAPTLGAIFLISWVTELFLSRFSQNAAVDVTGSIFYLVFLHALLPAVLEELLFRYIPLRFLAPCSRKYAVLLSALYFALVHCNLYQIPYAFAAGVIFAALDIISGSILPSLAFHFINNTVSLIWMKYTVGESAQIIFISVLSALTLISLAAILLKRKTYKLRLCEAFHDDGKERISFIPLFFTAVALLMAVLNLQI